MEISPADGPVAVNGASGYIGSHICLALVKKGYHVRACVRNTGDHVKTTHLRTMNDVGPGTLELVGADLWETGAYDDACEGASCFIHTAAELGTLEGQTPQRVYDSGFKATQHVLASAAKSGTVRRFIYTSSNAAIYHPGKPKPSWHGEGYFTENDWGDDHDWPDKHGTPTMIRENIPKIRDVAYCFSKCDVERYLYTEGPKHGIECMSVQPCHVIGPLLCAAHQMPHMWQTKLGDMMMGLPLPSSHYWTITDVRDVAMAHVLAAECAENSNGSRYLLVANGDAGMMKVSVLQDTLRKLYPGYGIGGEYSPKEYKNHQFSILQGGPVIEELGLEPHDPVETIKATVDSLMIWGLIQPRKGADNYSWKGNKIEGLSGNVTWTANLTSPTALAKM